MYDEEQQNLPSDMACRVRECTQQGLQITKEICNRVVSCLRDPPQIMPQHMAERGSPLVLYCVYSCASNLSYMAFETGNPQYTNGKIACEDMLRSVSARWETAGTFMQTYFSMNHYCAPIADPWPGIYLELQRTANLALDEGS